MLGIHTPVLHTLLVLTDAQQTQIIHGHNAMPTQVRPCGMVGGGLRLVLFAVVGNPTGVTGILEILPSAMLACVSNKFNLQVQQCKFFCWNFLQYAIQ